jgi:hypothetical protein
MTHDDVLRYGLVVISLLTSFLMTFYGMTMIMSGASAQGPLIFAYVTIAYGLGHLAVLSHAWSSREPWAIKINILFACCFLGVVIIEAVRNGLPEGSNAFSLVVLLVVLGANILAIKKIVERP